MGIVEDAICVWSIIGSMLGGVIVTNINFWEGWDIINQGILFCCMFSSIVKHSIEILVFLKAIYA